MEGLLNPSCGANIKVGIIVANVEPKKEEGREKDTICECLLSRRYARLTPQTQNP